MDLLAGLQMFVRVVEIGSFSAVAREINSSHSAVTRQIGQLEEHFRARLFHRSTRRLSLTDDGSALLDHARRMLDEAAAMEDQIGQQRASPTGHVRVGLPIAVARFILPRLSELLRRYPGLTVDLDVDDQLRDMIESQIDVAFRAGQIADSSLIARSLGAFWWIFVASPDYVRRAGEPLQPEDLAQHECIVNRTNTVQSVWRFGTLDEPLSVTINGALIVNDSEVARQAALAGHGIARLSGIHAVDDLRNGRLVQVLSDFPTIPVPIHLVYPTRRHLAPRTRVLMEFLVEQIQQAKAMLQEDRREKVLKVTV